MTGLNPLNASAATLFALVSRIRNRAQHADPDALRRSVVAGWNSGKKGSPALPLPPHQSACESS
jgi:hypothetical protein